MFLPIRDTRYSRLYVNHRPVRLGWSRNDCIGITLIVGNIANNVRPLMRPTRNQPTGLGAAMPILEWANAIGDQWVNDTVRSYRQGAK